MQHSYIGIACWLNQGHVPVKQFVSECVVVPDIIDAIRNIGDADDEITKARVK